MDKPPYKIPSMAEVRATSPNGFTVASTFAGCGGSSTGYRMAGFSVVWANEFIPAAFECYRANKADRTVLDERDIRAIKPDEILDATGLIRGELDVLDGSPPCASFSMAGKREHTWGQVRKYSQTEQRVDDLFAEFARLVDGLRPRVFVAENVGGLVRGVSKGWFLEILGMFRGLGYQVEARLLDAQWLGVPQARARLIFIGVRDDVGKKPAFPRPLKYRYSVRDAIPWIDRLAHGSSAAFDQKYKAISVETPLPTLLGGNRLGLAPYQFDVERARVVNIRTKSRHRTLDEPAPTIQSHGRPGTESEFTVECESDMTGYAVGDEVDKLAPGQTSKRYFQLKRAPLDGPSQTIAVRGQQGDTASVAHPIERRKFSIAELRRICGFPDDFVLTGTYTQQWERLGRAVPPPMMRAIAETIRDEILK